jgi:hypothetical protein
MKENEECLPNLTLTHEQRRLAGRPRDVEQMM